MVSGLKLLQTAINGFVLVLGYSGKKYASAKLRVQRRPLSWTVGLARVNKLQWLLACLL